MTALAYECMHALSIALKTFGEYSFEDKGPQEVMNIDELAQRFRANSVDYAAQTFKDILTDKEHGKRLASAILLQLQDWDELWDKHGEFLGRFL